MLMPVVFVGGMSSIGIELATSRLIAPYFGTSTFIWANLIGLTLAYLALGYYLGGRLADRYASTSLLYLITALAGFASALIPFLARPVLRASLGAIDNVDAGAFYGSLIGVIVLLAVPVTLFGFVTPFAIRLRATDVDTAGSNAGRVWAISTVGSIAGSFLPVLLLIPLVGTRNTFLIMALAVIIVSGVGLLGSSSPRFGLVTAVLAALLVVLNATVDAHPIKPPYRGVLLAEAESAYHYIQVLDENGVILLALNEGHAIHSIYNPATPLTGGPWDYFSVAPLFLDDAPDLESSLIIGLAGGTAARTILDIYAESTVDGVEIDEEIVSLGREYFALDDPRITTEVEDGRFYLTATDQTWDLIGIDAYRQPYIPFHLTTREFFEETARHLTDQGMVVVNAGRSDTDYRLVDALSSTMLDVFPHVFLIDTMNYDNTLIIGTFAPASVDAFLANAGGLESGSTQAIIAEAAMTYGNIRVAEPTIEPYTDDRAPVEWLIDQMIVDAAREEET
ncbi:MAG: fused MFS/spermidine synthase [Thermomicrobiales bacterium]|nr:fused MFS/spermidine synthase [Thermomicrobiales bacterium]